MVRADGVRPRGHLLIAASSLLLWILYLPAVVGQMQIFDLMVGADPSLPLVLPRLAAALVLYPVLFGTTLLLVGVRRRIARPRCPGCGRMTERHVAVGQACEHCGADLAPWLYVAPPAAPQEP
jgi:hypothetical protein